MSRTIQALIGSALILSCFRVAGGQTLTTERVTSGLVFPSFVTSAPGDLDHLYVLEKNSGYVRVVSLPSGKFGGHNYLSLFPKMTNGSERGLLGLAFHPNYQQNGYAYVCYTDLNGDVTVERYTRSSVNPYIANANSGLVLFHEPKPYLQHNAGMVQFGPDGYLYISLGDGGGGYDPFNYAQTLDTLKGKILRIDVNIGAKYGIPPTNPFVTTPGARKEIFAYGLRNPWRFSVDSATGDIYIGDVGQELREELDFIPAGGGGRNFGWRCYEGDLCTQLTGCTCNPSQYTAPFQTYSHDQDGTAVIGGYVYRGCAIPWLQGTYFYADFGFGRIFSLRYDGTTVTDFTERTLELDPPGDLDIGSISSFGVDGRGEMYIVDYNGGEIFRIVPQTPFGPDCNGNDLPDACEIANGSASDVDQNGTIDTCVPGLAASNLYLGKLATFEFSGAGGGEYIYFLVSLAGKSPFGYCFSPANCLSLAPTLFVLAAQPADGQGKSQISVFLPPSLPITSFAMQCAVYRGPVGQDSLLSNVLVAENLGPAPGP